MADGSLFERISRSLGLRRREQPPLFVSSRPSGNRPDLMERQFEMIREAVLDTIDDEAMPAGIGGRSGFSGFTGFSGSSWSASGGPWGFQDRRTGVRFEGQRGYFGVPGWEGVPGLPEGWPEARPAPGYKPGERVARVDEDSGRVVVDGPEHPKTLYGFSVGDFVAVDNVVPLVSHNKKFIFNKTHGYIRQIIRAGYVYVEMDGQCPCGESLGFERSEGHCHWFPNSVLYLADESTAKFYVKGYL